MNPERLRIFISSPGDVAEERVIANNLVRRLSDEFEQQLRIEPVFWEHEPLLATSTFQKQIPPPRECEVAICVLWSRIGTRLPADITRQKDTPFGPVGSRYDSGTEYEFEDAALGFEENGKPDLLVYRKTAIPMVSLADDDDLERRRQQKKALDAFIQKWFFNPDLTLKAAFHSFATTSEFEQVLEEHLRKLIVRRLPADGGAVPVSKPSWTAGSPFRGLQVFDFEHAQVFFGRTQAVGDLLTALRTNAAAGRAFVLIVGVSGGGKSSLVRAGLLPLLVQPGVAEGAGLWRQAVMRPADSGDPIRSLAVALLAAEALPELGADGTTAAQLAGSLRQNSAVPVGLVKGALSQAAASFAREQRLTKQPDTRLVLVADQLEELFTLPNVTTADRQAFVAVLSALARGGTVWVVATLRGDFYHRCFELPELVSLQEGTGQYALPLPTHAEIGQIIRQPARAAGLSFEEDPVSKAPLDEVLREAAASSPESLPLLEFALEELYQRRTPAGLLTYASYRELGGVEGALAQRAETVYGALPQPVQATLPRVMRSLVTVGAGAAVARQQATIESVAPTPSAKTLADAFVQARLFSADRTEQGVAVVRVAHEALLRNWPRVQKWLEQDRERLIVRGRVSAAAARWEAEGRRSDLLLGEGKPLAEGEQLAASLGDELGASERALIATSQHRRASRRQLKRVAAAALIMLTLAAGVAAIYAQAQRAKANTNAVAAKTQAELARQNAARAAENAAAAERRSRDLEIGLALAEVREGEASARADWWATAFRLHSEAYARFCRLGYPTLAADVGLLSDLSAAPAPLARLTEDRGVLAVALSPDARRAVSADIDHVLRVWDVVRGVQVGVLGTEPEAVQNLLFDPDGRHCLSVDSNGTTKLWDVEALREERVFAEAADSLVRFAFNPRGTLVAGCTRDDRFFIWDVSSGKVATTMTVPVVKKVAAVEGQAFTYEEPEYKPHRLAFSPDGRWLLSSDITGEDVRLWDATSGQEIRRYEKGELVDCLVFSPDGRHAAAGGNGLTLRNVGTGKLMWPPKKMGVDAGTIQNLIFSTDSRLLIAADDKGTIRYWDVEKGGEVRQLSCKRKSWPNDFQFSVGRFALSTGDSEICLWDPAPRGEPTADGLRKLFGITSDGRAGLSKAVDGSMWLWDLATGKSLQRFAPKLKDGSVAEIDTAALSSDGRFAVSGGFWGDIRMWDLSTGREIDGWVAHKGQILCVAFSPSGKLLVSSGFDGTTTVYDVNPASEKRLLHDVDTFDVRFSPDGDSVLYTTNGSLKRWTLSGDSEPASFTEGEGISCFAYAPDGHTVATGHQDAGLTLWDASSGKQLRAFAGHTAPVNAVAFSPDGNFIASHAQDGTLRLWDVHGGGELDCIDLHDRDDVNFGYYISFTSDGSAVIVCDTERAPRVLNLSACGLEIELQPLVERARTTLAQDPKNAGALCTIGKWYALRGVFDWAIECLEEARREGAVVSPLTLARAYWKLSGELSSTGTFTRSGCLTAAEREYKAAVAVTADEAERRYLQLCLNAVQREAGQPEARPSTQP